MLPKLDYRFHGLPHSTVEQDDLTCKEEEVVNKFIHQFETHPDREALKAERTTFSEKKKKNMIHCMENVEYFEKCKMSPKILCPHCLTY